jgi:cellulose synthase/poly-beta-1,6-N-acetylglucosamine synthase-like glycosyltransferase
VQFDAPLLQVLAPLMFVVGALYLLGPTLPISRPWARLLVFACVWLVMGRYLQWRVFTTVLPAHGAWYEIGWVWFCFAIELLAIGDALILYLCFLRSSDRRREADWNEALLRAQPPENQPSVDVYVATYNEPFEVLEKTITGALCLDYPNFKVWVLDDGRRPWLKEFCEAKGIGYITRPDNAHAKAGNINHALTKTDGEFVALFDADFVVQRNFLMRTIGFFRDVKIGIVQVPHTFYNQDPMQTNLALQKSIPDDQRFFFEAIMPSRDAWNAAFCCGSNSVTRRAALRTVGDQMPTESITEDMLLSLILLRNGYITRYLCEPLAFGLAPEGLKAFFIQRRRWARGAMQILYLAAGPLGKDLTIMQRLLFLPTHWLTQSLTYLLAIIIPLVFLWTGVLPMVNVTLESVLNYVIPTILATVGGICVYAPKQYFPLAAQVLGTFQSFKILPSVLLTLVKPFGHSFKVTPKGGAAKTERYDPEVFWTAATLMLLAVAGILINLLPEWRIITETALIPVVAGWSAYNILLLFLVCMLSLQGSVQRGEERFTSEEPVWMIGPGGARSLGQLEDISLSGAGILSNPDGAFGGKEGEALQVFISEVGNVPGHVARHSGQFIGVKFGLGPSVERDLLIRKLFTSGLVATTTVSASTWSVTAAILKSIWSAPSAVQSGDGGDVTAQAATPRKLPAESLVIYPHAEHNRWADLAMQRRAAA